MLGTRDVSLGVGWGGVGWGGDDDVACTCTHVWCYAHGMFLSGWGGVGWGWWRTLHLHTCLMLRTRDVSLGVGWGGAGWGWWRTLHLHTCLMLRTRDVSLGVGWGGDDDVPCTCTHVWCYALGMFLSGWGGVGMMTFLGLAHMVDATQVMGWGGVGMMTFLGLAHMVDATQVMGFAFWGWDDDVPRTCIHDATQVMGFAFWGWDDDVPRTCTHDATQVMGWGVMTSFGVNLLIWTMLGWHLNHCCWVLKVDYNHHLHLQDIWRLLWPWMFWRLTTIFYMFKYVNKSYLFWFPFNQVDVQSSLSKLFLTKKVFSIFWSLLSQDEYTFQFCKSISTSYPWIPVRMSWPLRMLWRMWFGCGWPMYGFLLLFLAGSAVIH